MERSNSTVEIAGLVEESEWSTEKLEHEAKKCKGKHSKLLLHLAHVEHESSDLKQCVQELAETNDRLKVEIPVNLREMFEKQTYEKQFVQLQKEQLTIERDGLLLQLQQENECYARVLQQLEQQSKTMTQMNNEYQREIAECQKRRGETHLALKQQERNHSLHMEKLKQRVLDKNLEDITCSICLSAWQASGAHRLVSLACGHLFGDECIRACLDRGPECPICRKHADHAALRYINL
ncbi:E3 ubiquitin-protein ligase rnf8-B-like [Drosophila guanche]|uniref:Blast:E3 ubiquitin-protein ligase RFWD3 n=1 Tax=Drosophila guanche TaxID=7266 RepID=A0A3B0K1Q5_DROGU|nr:E3 ubiquitin-protein ligase rnf8-B-like [Drosophila guanche]SPP79889.1 blast:E3 ubiquitin-protein ligase RFWD3 [Drosophila guanche]